MIESISIKEAEDNGLQIYTKCFRCNNEVEVNRDEYEHELLNACCSNCKICFTMRVKE